MKYDYEKQHRAGKLHAMERIELLLDRDSFVSEGFKREPAPECAGRDGDGFAYDCVITGSGRVGGRPVCVYSQDFSVMGGSIGRLHGERIAALIALAVKRRCPVVGIHDSGGARIQEGVPALSSCADIFVQNTRASGYIPQIAVVAGPSAGAAAYVPALMDMVLMVRGTANMFVTGPKVVRAVTGQDFTPEELGGADMHAACSGVTHREYDSERECFADLRRLLSYLPQNAENVPHTGKDSYLHRDGVDLDDILPQKNKPYDIRTVIEAVFDEGSFFELQMDFAKSAVIGFAKLCGRPVGVVANQPLYLAGVLDCDSSDKISRHVNFCNCFSLPLVMFTDVPGFMPGLEQESRGILRHGAKMLYSFSRATTQKLTVIVRKAYGGAFLAMNSRNLGADAVFAWPSAEIAIMGPESAVEIMYQKQLANVPDAKSFLAEKTAEYIRDKLNPELAKQEGYIDEIIQPSDTRRRLYEAMNTYRPKKDGMPRKKHGNIPL